MPAPTWLPEKIDVSGERGEVLARLLRVFEIDFVGPGCYFLETPVWWDRRVLNGQFEEGFWHLISRENKAIGDRFIDPYRAECLPWCRPCLVNSPDPALKIWSYKERKNQVRTYAWLEELDYVIVLEKRKTRRADVYQLVTAYSVDGASTKRRLEKKYQRREA